MVGFLVAFRLSGLELGYVFKKKGRELSWLSGDVIAAFVEGIGDIMDDLTSLIDFFGGLINNILFSLLKDYSVNVLSYAFSIGGKTLKAVVVTSCF